MARRLQRCLLNRYVVSTLTVVAAAVLTFAIRPLFGGKAPLFAFTIAVIPSASYGGLATGLLATALSGCIVLSLFEGPALVMAHSSLALFVLIGVVASVFIERLHQTNARLVRSNLELEAAKAKISEQADTLRRVNEKLSHQTEALLKANEELQRFAYVLAHDLNAPLRGISALTDLLLHRNPEKFDESSRPTSTRISEP